MDEKVSFRSSVKATWGVIRKFLATPSFFAIPRINILLFIATFFTTYIMNGPGYAICIMIILFAHEMGHFIMCRKYRVDATWPYFLPFPSFFGTLGAVIKMKGHIPNKRALFDIGVAGPIAGLIFAIPVTLIGLHLSEIHVHNTSITIKLVFHFALTIFSCKVKICLSLSQIIIEKNN